MERIISSLWWTNRDGSIGVVAVRTGLHEPESGEWKAYIGVGCGYDQKADERYIADWGNGLVLEHAAAFFPHLDITKYKSY